MNTDHKHFIESNRIYLRQMKAEDVEGQYFEWMMNPIVNQYLESRFFPISRSSLYSFIETMNESRNDVLFAIVDKENEIHLGNIKIGNINWIHRVAEVGLLIGEKEFWGKGYATEAIEAVADYAFNILNLRKIWAGIYSPNAGSIKAFIKAGFVEEGIKKKHFFYQGRYVDGIVVCKFNGGDCVD